MATSANSTLRSTGLAYDTIRSDLVNFLSTQTDLQDYDYTDSAIANLLDILAYNTYLNSFYTNMAVNEAFLDTAKLKSSVISRAKALAYVPTSCRGSTARIKVSWAQAANSTLTQLIVPKNSKFTTTVNSVSYDFVTPSSTTITANSSDGFMGWLNLTEGTVLKHRYTVGSNDSFALPNANSDTSSISVEVYNNASNIESYTVASDITQVAPGSLNYFLETELDGRYKIQFGDNIIGKKPKAGANVHIEYRVANGPLTNGANNFILSGSLGGFTDITILSTERASGGTGIQDTESIRFNAPRLYETQNRAVTAVDYERIIKRDFADIETVSVWGGEENDPPIYGKVYICAKPYGGTLISDNKKTAIRNNIKRFNVLSIEPEFVNPTYLYIIPMVTVRYSSTQTSLSATDIQTLVANKIIEYENNSLGKFENRKFYYSQFLRTLDDVSEAIVSLAIDVKLEKRFNPSIINKTTYKINFNNTIKEPVNATGADGSHYLWSSTFGYGGQNCYFDDNGLGTIRIYYTSAGKRIYLSRDTGNIDYGTGLISINSFLPVVTEALPAGVQGELRIQATPASNDVTGVRNQLMLITGATVTMIDNDTSEVKATTVVQTSSGVTTTLLSDGINSVVY